MEEAQVPALPAQPRPIAVAEEVLAQALVLLVVRQVQVVAGEDPLAPPVALLTVAEATPTQDPAVVAAVVARDHRGTNRVNPRYDSGRFYLGLQA